MVKYKVLGNYSLKNTPDTKDLSGRVSFKKRKLEGRLEDEFGRRVINLEGYVTNNSALILGRYPEGIFLEVLFKLDKQQSGCNDHDGVYVGDMFFVRTKRGRLSQRYLTELSEGTSRVRSDGRVYLRLAK